MDIFISYQNRAQDVADKIFEKLQSNNLHCWYAPRIQYGDYAKRITEAIKLCKVFIVMMHKLKAPLCKGSWRHSRLRGCFIEKQSHFLQSLRHFSRK